MKTDFKQPYNIEIVIYSKNPNAEPITLITETNAGLHMLDLMKAGLIPRSNKWITLEGLSEEEFEELQNERLYFDEEVYSDRLIGILSNLGRIEDLSERLENILKKNVMLWMFYCDDKKERLKTRKL